MYCTDFIRSVSTNQEAKLSYEIELVVFDTDVIRIGCWEIIKLQWIEAGKETGRELQNF